MSEESEALDTPKPKPQPTTQQEFNLAAMDAIRHAAQYALEASKLAGYGAALAIANAKANGREDEADLIIKQGEEVRRAGLRYHNSAMDLWDAFQRDCGDELVTPRETSRVPEDE